MFRKISSLLASKRSFVNILSTNAVSIVGVLAAIFLTPYILHTIGTNQYAIWIVLNSIVGYFSLSRLGFNTKMLRDLSAETGEGENKIVNSFLFSILFVQLLLFPLMLLSYFWLKIFIKPGAGEYLLTTVTPFYVLYFAFLFNVMRQVFATIFYSRNKHYFVNLIAILKIVLNFVLIILVGSRYTLNLLILSLITLGVSVIQMVLLCFKSKGIVSFSIRYRYFDRQYIKASLMPSLQYFVISIGALIIFHSDSLVISSLLGTGFVAIYAIGYRIVELPQRLLWNISDVLFPKLTKFYTKQNWADLSMLLKKIFCVVIPLNVILTIILYLFGTDLLRIWVGAEYVVAQGVLNIFIITFFFQTIAHTYGVIINAIGKQKVMAYMVTLEAGINLAISIILVQKIGIIGVALGTLIAHFCVTGWFSIYYAHKNLKVAFQPAG